MEMLDQDNKSVMSSQWWKLLWDKSDDMSKDLTTVKAVDKQLAKSSKSKSNIIEAI